MASGTQGRRVRVLAAAAITAALALGYLGTRYPSSAPAAPVEKLSIAVGALPHFSLIHFAATNGYFVEEGLDVTIVSAGHGKAAIGLVLEGKADLATAAEVPFVVSVMKGEDLSIAASIFSSSTTNAIVARRDRGIAAPRDLVGKKVGATFGTSGDYFLWALLIRNKLSPDSVTLVDVPPGQIAEELAKASVEAVAAWRPIVFNAQSALGENAATFTEAHAYTETHVVVGRSGFLRGHPRAVEKLVRALLKAEQFNRSQPEAALKLVAEQLKVDIKVLQPGWKEYNFKVDLLQSHLITMEDQARWAMARRYAPAGPVPNLLPHLYLDALLAVEPERVTVVR